MMAGHLLQIMTPLQGRGDTIKLGKIPIVGAYTLTTFMSEIRKQLTNDTTSTTENVKYILVMK